MRNVSPSQTEVNVFDFRLFQVHIGQHEKINNKQCGSNTPCVYLHTEHQPIQHENHHLFKCSYRIVVQRMKNDVIIRQVFRFSKVNCEQKQKQNSARKSHIEFSHMTKSYTPNDFLHIQYNAIEKMLYKLRICARVTWNCDRSYRKRWESEWMCVWKKNRKTEIENDKHKCIHWNRAHSHTNAHANNQRSMCHHIIIGERRSHHINTEYLNTTLKM